MEALAVKKTRSSSTSFLLQIAFCPCGKPYNRQEYTKKGNTYSYYFCPDSGRHGTGCTAKTIRRAWLDELVESMFLAEVGDLEVLEKHLVPGLDNSKELADIEQ